MTEVSNVSRRFNVADSNADEAANVVTVVSGPQRKVQPGGAWRTVPSV